MTYGFIGLGHQGTPMAERMISGALRPWLWARRSEILERYEGSDCQLARSPSELAAQCDVIGLCLYDGDATDAVLFGPEGLMEGVRPGTVMAIHATVGPSYVSQLATRLAKRDIYVVDAPVSGGPAAALGQLLVITGGDDEPLRRCAPMFATYAGKVVHTGDVGTAQAAKLVNNSLMAAITGLVFDAFELGSLLAVEREGLGAVLANGSAANPSVGTYLDMGAENFSAGAWPTLHKDVDLARSMGVATPLLLNVATATIAEMDRRRSARQG
jgi:3-hydroxyisobutyrate dehydrogenase